MNAAVFVVTTRRMREAARERFAQWLFRVVTPKLDCDVCELKARCCPNAVARKIPRDLHEDARDLARAHAATPEYAQACRRRKKIEMLFAHLKRILRLTRLRLRGPNGANDEFLLAATVQNLRRLARLRPMNMLPEMLAA